MARFRRRRAEGGGAVGRLEAALDGAVPEKGSAGRLAIPGLALTHAWILAPYLSGSLFYICFHLGFACTLVACAARYRAHPAPVRADAAAPWAAAGLMCLGTLAVFVADGRVDGIEGVCGVLGGAGSAYCFARWFYLYCALLAPKEAVGSTLLAFALSGCVRLFLVALQAAVAPALPAVLAALPFCSTALLVRCERAARPEAPGGARPAPASRGGGGGAQGVRSAPGPLASFGPLVLELAVYGVVFGALRNGMSEWSIGTPSMLFGHLLRIVLPLLLLWWLQLRTAGSAGGAGLRAAVLATAAAVLAAVFLGGLGPVAASAIVLAARSFVSVLIYVRLFDVAYRTGAHPCCVYGAGRAVYEVGLVCGLALYDGLLSRVGLDADASAGVLYFAVSCILVVMLNGFAGAVRLPVFQPAPGPGRAGVPAVQTATLDEACARVAGDFGLTEREADVLRHICRGYTKKRIAGVMGITEDTVRYHTKALYRKLGVHNRQELLDVVGLG